MPSPDAMQGLDEAAARARLAADGPNELSPAPRPGATRLLARQLASSMVLLLAGAAAVSLAIGELVDAAVIAAIVVLDATLGYVQERRADDAARAVRELLSPSAVVVRDGRRRLIPARDVVVGDVLAIQAGQRVAADARLLAARALQVDESMLTGESLPVDKAAEPAVPEGGDDGQVFAGTSVVHGQALARVTATGPRTQLGQIAAAAGLAPPRTPLEQRLDRLTADIVRGAVGVCLGLAVLAWLQGESVGQSALIGISLAVAAVPEGLPAVVTVTLAIGVRQMARRRAIVRRLQAVETLGSTSVICTDKTGTLTENRLAVTAVVPAPDGAAADASRARRTVIGTALRASESPADGVLTDPIEEAIATAARSEGLSVAGHEKRESMAPFDPVRKRASVILADPARGRAIYVKGAPEMVIPLLADGAAGGALRHEAERLAQAGARVLLVARRDGVTGPIEAEERELQAVGLLAFSDTPRPTARESVAAAARAGIRTIMVTGDHPGTARAVAELTGIVSPDRAGEVLTGPDLDELSDAELERVSEEVDVFARVVPAHKLRLVQALRRRGNVVAMTGDGVNDVPALRVADIGVAMGMRGSDAAVESADLVLADDDYTTIVAAVERGRTIYRNIRHFSHYLLAANTGEVLVFAAAIAAGVGAPLTVVQILLVNLLTDGLPAAALAGDPPERQVMRRPPRPRTEGLLAGLGPHILLVGLATGLSALASYLIGHQETAQTGRTMAFTTLVASQLTYVFSARTEGRPWQAAGNPLLVAAVAISGATAAAILAIPALGEVFDVASLSSADLVLALALGAVPIIAAEALKTLLPRRS